MEGSRIRLNLAVTFGKKHSLGHGQTQDPLGSAACALAIDGVTDDHIPDAGSTLAAYPRLVKFSPT